VAHHFSILQWRCSLHKLPKTPALPGRQKKARKITYMTLQ